jgi:two-component system sensor histidine kinase RegB
LLQAQAVRCREILRKLTRTPSEPDPLHARMSITQLIDEAADPYRGFDADIVITVKPEDGADPQEPVGERRPGVIYGLGNLVENAVDFARQQIEVAADWSGDDVGVTITDDGPGFAPEIMDRIGEPYVTSTRRRRLNVGGDAGGGLGLGFFIAKTLLERSGATLTFENRTAPERGAVVRVRWGRGEFEQPAATIS